MGHATFLVRYKVKLNYLLSFLIGFFRLKNVKRILVSKFHIVKNIYTNFSSILCFKLFSPAFAFLFIDFLYFFTYYLYTAVQARELDFAL